MSNGKISLRDNQYIVNGLVKTDVEIVEEMTKWATDTFIFRNNDVLMPEMPRELFGSMAISKHDDLRIKNFIEKYGNYSIKYLLYTAFINGYEAGIARAENDSKENIEKTIDKIVDESIPKEKMNIEKTIKETTSESVQNNKAHKISAAETENKEEISEKIENKQDKNDITVQQENIDEELTKYTYDENKRLIVDSSKYVLRTYEKYISKLIEDKLKFYGMDVNDIYSSGFPTYILGELLLKIDEADAVNESQKEIKSIFYNYFKDFHEKLTKTNTTV